MNKCRRGGANRLDRNLVGIPGFPLEPSCSIGGGGRRERFRLTGGEGAGVIVRFLASLVTVGAEDRFSADIRPQQEAGRTPRKECCLQSNTEERCPGL